MADREDWQTGLCKLMERTCYMLDKSWRTDVNFQVGPEGGSRLISGHKLIMAMASPVFEAMFYGEMAENVDLPIRIPDVDPDAFQVLLKYVYTDDITFSTVDAALNLWYAAHKYMMPDLAGECTLFVSFNLSAKNACIVYEFAQLLSVQFLKEKCLEIFKYYTETVLRSDSFAHSNHETVFAVLSLDEMNVPSEKFVFDRTLAWGLQQCRSKGNEPTAESVSKELAEARVLFEIRYLTMTPEEFISVSSESQLFSDEEVLAILINIVVPGARAMPASLNAILPEISRQNRCQKKYYCRLNDKSSSDASPNISVTAFAELGLLANKNITLHGFVFDNSNDAALTATSQNNSEEEVHVKVSRQEYNQAYYSDYDDYDDNIYSTLVEYKFPVKAQSWDRNVLLCFPNPFHMQENTRYKLLITFKTSRDYYKFPLLKSPQKKEGVTFYLQDQNDVVAIHTIIFSHADVE